MSEPATLLVRLAGEADIPAIAAFARELYTLHHDWDPVRFWDLGGPDPARRRGREQFFRAQLADSDSVLLVAEAEGVVVGYAYFAIEEADYESLLESAAWLHDLYVVPEARGGGAAAHLFRAACDRARAAGSPLLVLTVAEANLGAQRFFARLGARPTMREMVVELGPKLPPSARGS